MTSPTGKNRAPTWARTGVLWLLVAGLVGIGMLFLLVYPIGALLDQKGRLSDAEARLELLQHQNRRLDARSRRLTSDAEIERITRDRYNMVRPGEQAWAVVPGVATTTTTAPAPAVP